VCPPHRAKCVDPYVGLKRVLNCTSKLQKLLDSNNLGSKTGSGGDAIKLAQEGRFKELIDYCMMDVLLTHELCSLEIIKVNKCNGLRLNDEYQWEMHCYTPPVYVASEYTPITISDALFMGGDSYSSAMSAAYDVITFDE
jgi:hypothetical protein